MRNVVSDPRRHAQPGDARRTSSARSGTRTRACGARRSGRSPASRTGVAERDARRGALRRRRAERRSSPRATSAPRAPGARARARAGGARRGPRQPRDRPARRGDRGARPARRPSVAADARGARRASASLLGAGADRELARGGRGRARAASTVSARGVRSDDEPRTTRPRSTGLAAPPEEPLPPGSEAAVAPTSESLEDVVSAPVGPDVRAITLLVEADLACPRRCSRASTRVRRAARFYPPEHPAVQDAVRDLSDVVSTYHAEGVDVPLAFFEDELLLGEQLLTEESVLFDQLIRDMTAIGAGSARRSRAGSTVEELERAVRSRGGPDGDRRRPAASTRLVEAASLPHVAVGARRGARRAATPSDQVEDARGCAQAVYGGALELMRELERLIAPNRAVERRAGQAASSASCVDNVLTNRYAMLELTGLRTTTSTRSTTRSTWRSSSLALGSVDHAATTGSCRRWASARCCTTSASSSVDLDDPQQAGRADHRGVGDVRQHPVYGAEMAALDARARQGRGRRHPRAPHALRPAGYPQRVPTRPQHLASRIVAVADAYDAMTSRRTLLARRACRTRRCRCSRRTPAPRSTRRSCGCSSTLMGVYPPRSVVRLDTGETAVVLGPSETRRRCVRSSASSRTPAATMIEPFDVDLADRLVGAAPTSSAASTRGPERRRRRLSSSSSHRRERAVHRRNRRSTIRTSSARSRRRWSSFAGRAAARRWARDVLHRRAVVRATSANARLLDRARCRELGSWALGSPPWPSRSLYVNIGSPARMAPEGVPHERAGGDAAAARAGHRAAARALEPGRSTGSCSAARRRARVRARRSAWPPSGRRSGSRSRPCRSASPTRSSAATSASSCSRCRRCAGRLGLAHRSLLVLTLLLTAVVHLFDGAIRPWERLRGFAPHVKAHLSVLARRSSSLSKAFDYWLRIFELELLAARPGRRRLATPTCTRSCPRYHILIVIALIAAARCSCSTSASRAGGCRRSRWACGSPRRSSSAASSRRSCSSSASRPTRCVAEAPYIERNIEATRAGVRPRRTSRRGRSRRPRT